MSLNRSPQRIREILDGWRSPLEQIVYAFVLKYAKNAQERGGSAFPICLTRQDFDMYLPDGVTISPRSGRSGVFRAVGPDAFAVIEGLQPYRRGDVNVARTDPLFVLSALRNKQHQKLHVVRTQAHVTRFEIPSRGS